MRMQAIVVVTFASSNSPQRPGSPEPLTFNGPQRLCDNSAAGFTGALICFPPSSGS
jgi:hypothetical protein